MGRLPQTPFAKIILPKTRQCLYSNTDKHSMFVGLSYHDESMLSIGLNKQRQARKR